MSEKGPLYRPVNASDAEGTAIAVAFELWRAQLKADVLNDGPATATDNVQEFSGYAAEEIGTLAGQILREMTQTRSKT